MGFYLRKSFRAGPIRFNLSKSGIGVSAGVTGARLGVSSTGRAYVHGGRGGLYYRQSLGSGSGLRRSGAAGDIAQRRAASRAPIELTANRRDGRDVRQPGAAGGDRPIRGADTARIEIRPDRAVPRRRVTPTAACSTSGSGPPIPSLTMYRQKSTPRERVAGSLPADAGVLEQRAYSRLVEAGMATGWADPADLERLSAAEQVLSLDPEFVRRARLDAYRRAHVGATADCAGCTNPAAGEDQVSVSVASDSWRTNWEAV